MNRIVLFVLDKLASLFVGMGVNYPQLRTIVDVKITMDNRRTKTNLYGQKSKESSRGFLWQTLLIGLFASLVSLMIIFVPQPTVAFALVSAYTIVMITMILITDFSQVMLDNSDAAIILTRPVSNKTLFVAKFVHIVFYLLQLALACTLPAVIITIFKYGVLPAWLFLVLNLLLVILAVFVSNLLYLLVMRFWSQEKLQNIINYVQIIIAVTVMGGYRVVGKLFDIDLFDKSEKLVTKAWHYFLPPLWAGNLMNDGIAGNFTVQTLIFALLTLGVPILAVYALNTGLLDNFGSRLSSMDVVEKKQPAETKKATGNSLSALLSRIFTKTPAERATFEMVWKITSRDRGFKLRTYPSIAYLLIYIPIILFTSGSNLAETVVEIGQSNTYLVGCIYFSAALTLVVRNSVKYYEKPQAAWVYSVIPLATPGELLNGQMWSINAKFQLPMVLVIGAFIGYVWKLNGIDDLIAGTLVLVIVQQVYTLATKSDLPFSKVFEKGKNSSFLSTIGFMTFAGLLAMGHWALTFVPYVVAVLIPFEIMLLIFLNKEIRKLGWEKIK